MWRIRNPPQIYKNWSKNRWLNLFQYTKETHTSVQYHKRIYNIKQLITPWGLKQPSKSNQCFSPCYPNPYDLHTAYQLRWTTLRGVPLKIVVQEALKEEEKQIRSHSLPPLVLKNFAFVSHHNPNHHEIGDLP